MTAGLLCVSAAYGLAWIDEETAGWLRWFGLTVIFVAAVTRLTMMNVPRAERIGIVIWAGIVFYLVKIFYSPLAFKFADELQHWRTTDIILETGELFTFNPMLPVSPYYPALQNLTVALSSLSGLSITVSGMIVVGIIRIIYIGGMYLFFERVSHNSQIASLGTLIYMTNPHFQFLNSMFTYQAMGLAMIGFAFATYTLWLYEGRPGASSLVALLALFGVTVSHHVSSYMHVAYLMFWVVVATFTRQKGRDFWIPVFLAVVALIGSFTWTTRVATPTAAYLSAPIERVQERVFQLIERPAEEEDTDEPVALEEDEEFSLPFSSLATLLIALQAVGWIALLTPIGAYMVWMESSFRNAPAMTLGLVGVGYYASILLRFGPDGAELAGRSWPFLFIGVGFTLAYGFVRTFFITQQGRIYAQSVCVMILSLIFVGGMQSSWPPGWARLPGPYLVGASERSVEFEGIHAAEWARENMPIGSRTTGTFTMYLLFGSLGQQYPVFGLAEVYASPRFGAREVDNLENREIRYFVVDYRVARSLPYRGTYFGSESSWEVDSNPITIEVMDKFEEIPDVDRIFDSGNLVIYDLQEITNVP